MLRRMPGKANSCQKVGATLILDHLGENKMRWFGHVQQRNEDVLGRPGNVIITS